MFELSNLRVLKIAMFYKKKIVFGVRYFPLNFKGIPLKFHSKQNIFPIHWGMCIFIQRQKKKKKLKSSAPLHSVTKESVYNTFYHNEVLHILWQWQMQEVNWTIRADSRFAPNQWEKSLQSNAVSHWRGTNLESSRLWTHKDTSYLPSWMNYGVSPESI